MFGCILTEILIGTTLYDGEKCLMVAIEGFSLIETLDASVEPVPCKFQTLTRLLIFAIAWWAFVESHHDVGSDGALRIHDILGLKEML